MEFTVVNARSVRQRLLVITVRFIALSAAYQHDRAVRDESGRDGGPLGAGTCRYGGSTACCPGWRRVRGLCQPVCVEACVNGVCVGPDRCSCSDGFTGPRCDQDVNECGLVERPCSQRCMNTPGSFRCYCDPGYALHPDARSCTREPGCPSAHCQMGCQVQGGGGGGGGGREVRCLCPPGLRLAADNRTCEDVDECWVTPDPCPAQRTCRNTFGSFTCVCRHGLLLGTLHGQAQCRDKDECVTGVHRCSRFARCLNAPGSYACRCLDAYAGDGRTCRPRRAPQSKAAMYFLYKLSKRTRNVPPAR